MQALASTLLARATELARSAALSTWQRFSLSVELINAQVEQAAMCLESEQVQEALALLTSAHQHLSDGLELDEDHPHVDRYTALAEDLQARVCCPGCYCLTSAADLVAQGTTDISHCMHALQMLRLMAAAYLKCGNAALALQCVQGQRALPQRLAQQCSVQYQALQALLELERTQDAEVELQAIISNKVCDVVCSPVTLALFLRHHAQNLLKQLHVHAGGFARALPGCPPCHEQAALHWRHAHCTQHGA